MLHQSHLRNEQRDYIQDILPALPSALPEGAISGIKGRGGFELSMRWKDGRLHDVEVKSHLGNKLHMRYAGNMISRDTNAGARYRFSAADF